MPEENTRVPRRVRQVSISHARSECEQEGSFVAIALADDGTIWTLKSSEFYWACLPDLPEREA